MTKILNIEINKDLNINNIGSIFFFIGIFLLASAVGLGIIFLFIATTISFFNSSKFFKDKWNYPFLLGSFLMIISTIVHFNNSENNLLSSWDPNLSLIGLTNWIPFFFAFWGLQKYLDSPKKRIITAKILICGSIPVIFSGILQLFNVNGPFQLLNGLIVWFQKPISDVGSLSGLFNNQNYAGLWMVMVWPFCLSELMKKRKELFKKYIVMLICLVFVIFISLTDSRNAILGLIISSPIVLGSSSLIWYLPSIGIGLFLLALTVVPIFPAELQAFMKSIVPARIYTLFPEIGFSYLKSYPRINKWSAAISFIAERPLFGWGAASFPILYQLKSGDWFGHSHNLPFELALSYGIFPTLIIFSTIFALIIKSSQKLYANRNIQNNYFKIHQRAWFASTLIFFISHLVDIQYFDARISIFCWILLAGLRSYLREDDNNELKLEK